MKRFLSIILAIVFIFSLSSNALAAPVEEEHEHVYNVISKDDRYITGIDDDGNIFIHDKMKEISPNSMLRAACTHSSTYLTTFREHNANSPICAYLDSTYKYCNNCDASWLYSQSTGTHTFNAKTCTA